MVSVLVVVERVVLIFVEERKEAEGTRYEVTKDFSSKHYSYQYLFLLYHTQTTII